MGTTKKRSFRPKFQKQTSPNWKSLAVNVKTPSSLTMLQTSHKMVFTGWLAELLAKDKERGYPPRDLQFWIFAENNKPQGRGMVEVGQQKFIFPFDQDFKSFLVLAKLIKNPQLGIPPVGDITLFVDYSQKPKLKPSQD